MEKFSAPPLEAGAPAATAVRLQSAAAARRRRPRVEQAGKASASARRVSGTIRRARPEAAALGPAGVGRPSQLYAEEPMDADGLTRSPACRGRRLADYSSLP